MKLLFPKSPLGRQTFADFSHGAGDEDHGLLLAFFGGLVSEQEYAALRAEEPERIFEAAQAAGHRGPLLALPYPPELPWHPGQALVSFTEHFEEELLPATGVEHRAIALVGFGLGAALAVLLARNARLPVCALAAIAPTGAAEAAMLTHESLGAVSCPVHIGSNMGDPLSHHARQFAVQMVAAGWDRPTLLIGSGENGLDAYLANGLAQKAFRFAASRLAGHRGGA